MAPHILGLHSLNVELSVFVKILFNPATTDIFKIDFIIGVKAAYDLHPTASVGK